MRQRIEGAAGALVVLALLAAALAAAGAQPSPQKTGVSIGPAVAATCADAAAGQTQVATFAEWVRFAQIQNLSSNDLEIETNATTTNRGTCNCVLTAGQTVSISNELKTIAIKNVGATTADFTGTNRNVVLTGWR